MNIPFGLEWGSNAAEESVVWGTLQQFVKAEIAAFLELGVFTLEFRRLRRDGVRQWLRLLPIGKSSGSKSLPHASLALSTVDRQPTLSQ